jgi:luciferase family oxidoreductase group 1
VIPLSVLDLAPIVQGSDAAQAFHHSRDLARHTEQWGYHRFWLAEHHGMPGVASAATSIVIAHVAAATSRIRVGAGGIMLPNHSPLVVAEQFGTLESLYPGRIDLALGRAPGTDPLTARALRRHHAGDAADAFPQDVLEVMRYFQPARPREPAPDRLRASRFGESRRSSPEDLLRTEAEGSPYPTGAAVRAVPGEGLRVPVWILGSSLFGASLAAALGLPYAFASHFAPAQLMEAIALYRREFTPSDQLPRPHVMLGFNVIAAPSDEEAKHLFTSIQQAFLNLRRGQPAQLPPPVPGFEKNMAPAERAMLEHALACSAVGSPETVRRGVEDFVARTAADELIVTSQIYDHAARLRSYEILARVTATEQAEQPDEPRSTGAPEQQRKADTT